MFRLLAFMFFLGMSFMIHAQSIPKLKRLGDKHFEASQYEEAIKYYEKIISIDRNNEEAIYNLATSNFRALKYKEAKKYYESLITRQEGKYTHLSYYYFGSILKLEANFTEADFVLGELLTLQNVDDELLEVARKQKEGCLLAINQQKANRGFSIREMREVNSELHDFGATVNLATNNMVLVTTRNVAGQQYKATQFAGLLPDLVQFELRNQKLRMENGRNNFNKLNTEWAEGSGSFTKDGTQFFFTSCRSNDGSDCKIMRSELIDNKWSEPVPLNTFINLDSTENKHPSISAEGDTLFFVSNREGGIGGSDIWMSLRGLDKESWTPAINMGDVINTPEDEITPYWSSAYECLLYASNGHIGYGGFDLFAAKGESFFEPQIYNLGDPFNSSLDDTYFAIADSVGFISSNRKDKSHLNIYTFNVSNEKLFLSLLISGESLIDERIISRFREIRTLDLVTFRVEDYQGFEIFEPVKKKPKPSLVKQNPFKKEEASEGVLADNTQGTEEPQYNPTVSFQPDRNQTERAYTSSPVVYPENNLNISGQSFEKLYFEFESANLTTQAKASLNNLAAQLRQKENMIETLHIVTHTDQYGSASYNLELSQKRGLAIKNYLDSKLGGISNVSLHAVGESNLLSSDTTWYDRLFNRRAEIIVDAGNKFVLNPSRIIIVRQEISLADAANLLGLEANEIAGWNNLNTQTLQRGQAIRIAKPLLVGVDLNYFLDETDVKYNFALYEVKEGETLQSISKKFKTPEELLAEINQIRGEVKGGDQIFVYRPSF